MKPLFITATVLSMILGGSFAVAKDGEKHHHKLEKMLEKVDTDKDGAISLQEHEAHTAQKFKEMDANGDGKATKEEIEAYYQAKREKWGHKGGHHCEDKDESASPATAPKE